MFIAPSVKLQGVTACVARVWKTTLLCPSRGEIRYVTRRAHYQSVGRVYARPLLPVCAELPVHPRERQRDQIPASRNGSGSDFDSNNHCWTRDDARSKRSAYKIGRGGGQILVLSHDAIDADENK
jgi:hypothetical protein